MEQFRADLDAMREACQRLPHDFGHRESVPEKQAVIAMIQKVEDELQKVKSVLRDM